LYYSWIRQCGLHCFVLFLDPPMWTPLFCIIPGSANVDSTVLYYSWIRQCGLHCFVLFLDPPMWTPLSCIDLISANILCHGRTGYQYRRRLQHRQ